MAKRAEKLSKPVSYALFKGKLIPREEVLQAELDASEASVSEVVVEKPKPKTKPKKKKAKSEAEKEAEELAALEDEIAKLGAEEALSSDDETIPSDFEVND